MNQRIAEALGRVYLAKDMLLTAALYQKMYPRQEEFAQTLAKYASPMRSNLATR